MTHSRAPAKINLGLHVLRRRPDGHHDVETVLWPFAWSDEVGGQLAYALRFTCSDPSLPTDEGNLVVRAAKALAEEPSRAQTALRGAHLHLIKNVPYGAGLGSGSSDAAATLLLLNDLWHLALPDERLHAIAAALGADVPFFLRAEPALATGRGDVLSPLTHDDGTPYRLPFALVVAVPPVHVSTAEAYRIVTPREHPRPDLAAVVRSNDLDRWRRELANDFEEPILARHPEVARAKARLVEAGAGYAALSGSGAAVFGVFERSEEAASAARALHAQSYRVWAERPVGMT